MGAPPSAPWGESAGGALWGLWEDALERGVGRGPGLGTGRGGRVRVLVVLVEGGLADSCVSSAEQAAAAFLEEYSFLSSETFPMWMGNINMTSGDFRQT